MASYFDDHDVRGEGTTSGNAASRSLLRLIGLMGTLDLSPDETGLDVMGSSDPVFGAALRAVSAADPEALSQPPASRASIEALSYARPGEQTSRVRTGGGAMACPVCTEEFDEEPARKMPCGHMFHGDCIIPWLKRHNTCPLCRYEMPTDDTAYEEAKRNRARKQAADSMYNAMIS